MLLSISSIPVLADNTHDNYPELGELVSYEQYPDADGNTVNEYTYVAYDGAPATYDAASGNGTFNKVQEVVVDGAGVVLRAKVSGYFVWNQQANTVTVSSTKGEILYNDGHTISKESVTTSYSGGGLLSKKATVTYKYTQTTTLGSVQNRSVKVSVNSKGQQS